MNVLQIKATVRERDRQRCTECGMTADEHRLTYGRTLDVHRIVPGSEYTLDGCVTLCKPCHSTKPQRVRGTVPRTHTVFRVPMDLYEELSAVAVRNGRRVNQELAIAFQRHVEQHVKKHRDRKPTE